MSLHVLTSQVAEFEAVNGRLSLPELIPAELRARLEDPSTGGAGASTPGKATSKASSRSTTPLPVKDQPATPDPSAGAAAAVVAGQGAVESGKEEAATPAAAAATGDKASSFEFFKTIFSRPACINYNQGTKDTNA